MGTRRMFSNRVIGSAKFLKMPLSTQALYFHLGMNADDDGIVEAYTVMKSLGAAEDDLRILVSKGFVVVLNNEDLICYLMDWSENNSIRADRKKDSIYKDLLLQIVPEAVLVEKKPRADTGKATAEHRELIAEYAEESEQAVEKTAEEEGIIDEKQDGQPMDNQVSTNGRPKLSKDKLREKSNLLFTEKLTRKESQNNPPDSDIQQETASISYRRIFDLYNRICVSLPRCIVSTDERKRCIKARASEFGEEKIEEAFRKVNESDFLSGRTDKFKATFDWIMKKGNFVKILEGNYDNAEPQTKKASKTARDGHDGFDNSQYSKAEYEEVRL